MNFDDISRTTLDTTRRVLAGGAIAAVAVFGAAACDNSEEIEQEIRDGVEQEVEEGIQEGIDGVFGGDGDGDGDGDGGEGNEDGDGDGDDDE